MPTGWVPPLAKSSPCQAVSHHLKLLLQAGLVQVAQEGKERYYSLDTNLVLQRLQALTASLANDILNQQTQKGESS